MHTLKAIVRNGDLHTSKVFPNGDLATQTGRIRQLIGEIQHIVLLVQLFRQSVVNILLEYQMARGAGQFSTTSSLQFNVIVVGYVQKMLPNLGLNLMLLPDGVDECDGNCRCLVCCRCRVRV